MKQEKQMQVAHLSDFWTVAEIAIAQVAWVQVVVVVVVVDRMMVVLGKSWGYGV